MLERSDYADGDDHNAEHAEPNRVEQGSSQRGAIERPGVLVVTGVEVISIDHAQSTQRPRAGCRDP